MSAVVGSAVVLPTSGDPEDWSADQKALLDAAGLVKHPARGPAVPAPRSTVVAFLAHCARTGLDPIARQIYAIERGGKWTITVSIDGFRIVAQRSGAYAGQTPVEWTGDGKTWFDVWLFDEPPAAARVGVYRRGFEVPLYAVARWSEYAVLVPVWENDRKTDKTALSPMWERMPSLMLGKVAEALALRRAFPMDLSGLYIEEELDWDLQQQAAPAARAPKKADVLTPGLRAAQREAVGGPTEGQDGSLGPDGGDIASAAVTGPDAGDSSQAGEGLFECMRCGEAAAEFEGGVCAPCEEAIEAEISGGGSDD
jgi:phage recombination protein Bet